MRTACTRVVVPALTVLLLFLSGAVVRGQDAGLALSTSVGYNTQRASLPLTAEQAKEAERLGREASRASQAGNYGEALNDYAQGMAVMHDVPWTPDVEFASALRGRADHAMLDRAGSMKVNLRITPLYATSRSAQAKLSAEVFLVRGGGRGGAAQSDGDAESVAPKAAIDPLKPFTEEVGVPTGSREPGNYALEVRLTQADGSMPEPLRAAFVKVVPIHIESLSGDTERLRASLNQVGAKYNPALDTARYTLQLYDRADRGEVNANGYKWSTEISSAVSIVQAVEANRDPFAGRHGDFHRAYLSKVDNTLQPYRLFVPDAYDGARPAPMVVALHGMGGDENSMFDGYGQELTADANRYGFVVVAPKGRDQASMYRGSAEQDVLDVMAEVERDYKIDKNRVYLMGHSMGGYGTWSVAMDHPDLFAALGPISGGGNAAGMEKIRRIPEYVTHGDNDKTVNVNSSRTMVEAGKKLGAPITYVEVPGGSHVSVAQPALAPMMEFFSRHSKSGDMSAPE